MCSLLGAASDPNLFQQLGIASIVCVLLSGALWTVWRKLLVEQAKKELLEVEKNAVISKLYEERIAREQFLSDRLAPLLADAVEILGTAPTRFETALAHSREATQASDLSRLVEKLEQTVRDIRP